MTRILVDPPRGPAEPHVAALAEGEELDVGGALGTRPTLRRPKLVRLGGLARCSRASRGGAVVPGDLDPPGRSEVGDDQLLVDTAATDHAPVLPSSGWGTEYFPAS